MRGVPRAVPVLAGVALTLAFPICGHASSLAMSAGAASYVAGAGEDNSLVITRSGGNYVFTDAAAVTITPTAPCAAGATGNVAFCPVAGVEEVAASLGNLDDDATADGSITETGALQLVRFTGGAGSDSLTGSPAVRNGLTGDSGAPAGNDVLTGGGLGDDLQGNDGADTLTGGDGSDVFLPGNGNDNANGGDGFDFFGAGAASGPDGADQFVGGGGIDRIALASRLDDLRYDLNGVADDGAQCPGPMCEGDNIQPDVEEVFGGPGDDVIVGTAGENDLSGNDGDDQVLGGGGRDDLLGGAGDDSMSGGPGADRFFPGTGADQSMGEQGDDAFSPSYSDFDVDLLSGGAGIDSVSAADTDLPLRVSLNGRADDRVASPLVTSPADNVGATIENVVGGPAGDVLIGNARANELDGGDGADRLVGLNGSDALLGGRGGDQLVPGKGRDTADGAGGADLIRSRDKKADQVMCGAARDRVRGDRIDRVAADCERVKR